jgi:MscS family membrane protein
MLSHRQRILSIGIVGFAFSVIALHAEDDLVAPSAVVEAESGEERIAKAKLASPRKTLKTFIGAFEEGGNQDDALLALDLSEMPPSIRDTAGPDHAARLKVILERMGKVDYLRVSDDGESEEPFRLSALISDPDVEDARDIASIVIAPDESDLWRFVPETVAVINELHEKWSDRKPIGGNEAVKPKILTPLWFEGLFPASWTKTRFLLADYQWLSLVGLLVFGLLLDQCVRLILSLIAQICLRFVVAYRGAEIGPHVFRPVGLLSQGFLWCYGTMLLGLPDSALSVILGLLKILTIIAGVRTMHLLIDALRRYALQRAAKTPTLHDDLLVLLTSRALKLLIICVGVLVAARAFDLPVVGILGGMGLGGIAIALASKDAISNLIGSFSVLVDRPFRVGDWVVINGIEGNIESIGFRSTRVRTFAHSLVTIPNSTMITTEIDNMGARRYRRIKTIIRIHYGTKPAVIDAFCEGVRELIKRHPYTRKDEYHIYLAEFGEHTIHVMLYCFIECEDWSIELREQHRFLGDVMRLAEELGIQVGGRYHYAADPSADISQSENLDRVGQEKAAHIAGPLLDAQHRAGDVEFGGPTDFKAKSEDPPPPEGEGTA